MGTFTCMYPVSMCACLPILGLGHCGTGRPSQGQNLNIKIYKNQNSENSENSKFTKFPNFQILHVNFILNIGYVNLNLSIFVELIDMDSLDKLQAEFN